MKKRTIYYCDPINDDFAKTKIKTIQIPADYRYIDDRPIYRLGETIVRALALPIIWLILQSAFLFRVKNKKVLRKAKGKGYFLYGNHTNFLLDAYCPSVMTFPRRAHIVTSPDAASIKGLRTAVKMLGAIPIPSTLEGMKRYRSAIDERIEKKHVVAIFPEAHIWPYYTDIRPFGTQSFHYPVENQTPCFAFTNIYTQRKLKFIRFPKVVSYVDGPFYPDPSLGKRERVQKLRDDIYAAMKKRVDEHPRYEYVEYVYAGEKASKESSKGREK